MAKEFFDWVKLALDNKWLVIMCFTGFSSVVTNAAQLMTNQDLEVETKASQEQIAMIANHYAATTTPKIVVQKSSCGNCFIRIKRYVDEKIGDRHD